MSATAATALALWGAAHAAGASADDVLFALAGCGVTAGVRADTAAVGGNGTRPIRNAAAGLPAPGEPPAGNAALLPLLRQGPPTLLLPRPGDVRGLPPASGTVAAQRMAEAALAGGAAVALPDTGVTVVPTDGLWRVFAGAGAREPVDAAAARSELDAAVAHATRVFVESDLGVDAESARRLVGDQLQQRTVRIPPGVPARVVGLLERCVQLESLLAVAAGQRTAAINLHGLGMVDGALSPLADAARSARLAAVDAAVRTMVPQDAPTPTEAAVSRPDRRR